MIQPIPVLSETNVELTEARPKVTQSRFPGFWDSYNQHPRNMADKCTTPDGRGVWTFGLGSKTAAMIFVAVVACIPMTLILLGPKLLFYVGGWFGYYLKKKTAGRKAQILEMVEADEKEFLAKGGDRQEDCEEWETVEAYTTGTSKNGETAEREWDGIVGFFHPFWYDALHFDRCLILI